MEISDAAKEKLSQFMYALADDNGVDVDDLVELEDEIIETVEAFRP